MVYNQTFLYKFLLYCNQSHLEKKIVDCGAGGKMPPLGLFYSEGYETIGIEMDDEQLRKARLFEEEHGLNLNIRKGDMRQLPFQDEEIPFLYSFGSIFHMRKAEIRNTIQEIRRVLKQGGLCYFNVLSYEDFRYGQGIQIGEGEFLQEENGGQVIHSYFKDQEAEEYLSEMEVLYKEIRIYERIADGQKIHQGSIEYIVRKK